MDPGEESPLMSSLPGKLHGASPRRERLGQMRQLPRTEMGAWPEGVRGSHPITAVTLGLMGQEKARSRAMGHKVTVWESRNVGHKKAK